MERSPGSAERPADDSADHRADGPVQPAEYMTGDNLPPPDIVKNSAARPAGHSEFYRLAFYNISWDAKSKKWWHTMDGLATEICDMVHVKCVDGVGINEVFNLKEIG